MQGTRTQILISSFALGLFLLLLPMQEGVSQDLSNYRFSHISTDDGLSQSTINDILQDSRGFLWFATDDGLNRYDGYNFEVFKNIPGDSTSLSSNITTGLIEDFEGNIWVATNGGGLNRFDRKKERFERFRYNPEDENSVTNNFITALYQDFTGVILIGTREGLNIFDPYTKRFNRYKASVNNTEVMGHNHLHAEALGHDHINDVIKDEEGKIWIATQTGGLYRFDRFEESFTRFGSGDDSGLNDNWVTTLQLDRSGTLWVGTQNNGLYRYDHGTETFQNFRYSASGQNNISHNWVLSIFEDQYGSLWVGTMNGLNLMDRGNGSFSNISQEEPTYLSNYSITSLFEDKSGVFWIGTRDGALNKLVRSTESFTVYQHEPGNPNSISNNHVWAVLEGTEGDVWLGTHGGGLNRLDPDTRQTIRYRHNPDDPASISDNFVNDLIEDRRGNIWIATTNGLNRYDAETNRFFHYKYDSENPNSISSNQITALMEDSEGIIWIGTLNNGLNSYDTETGEIRRYKHDANDPESLSHNKVWSMYEDSNGNFWLGTHGYGLNRYDRENDSFYHYKYLYGDPTTISDNFINFIFEDKNESLWIGTINGLNRFDPETQQFTRYTTANGLPNNVIYGIIEDDRGHLWLSTNRGIADFNPNTGTSRNYGVGDGLPGNEYRFGASHRGESGRMYFGGINGAVVFESDSIRDNPYKPPVALTNFQIFNRDVGIGEDSFLKESISETRDILISHRESVFSFEYAALHFASPRHNQYAFKLEGFEDEWQYVGNRRFTSYTNLPAGKYRFRVKAANKDGVWNETGSTIDLEITPPVWQTWWAYGLYGFMFTGFLIGVIQFRVNKEKLKKQRLLARKQELEKEVETRTLELAQEKERREELLHSILPGNIADELIAKGKSEPKKYDEVTILFTDFENFTETASSMSASRLVSELNEIFEVFDRILDKNGVEKIKTIGDSYMAVGGVPDLVPDHALRIVRAASEMMSYLKVRNRESSFKWNMRAGVHSGSIIAGVVGKNKFTYDIWGDTVIIASRMEATGETGRINVSAATRELIKDHFICEYRGKVHANGKGKLDMYFALKAEEAISNNKNSEESMTPDHELTTQGK